MGFLFLVLSLFIILVATGSGRDKTGESRVYMINIEWLADSDKFKLITRWGVK